MSREDEDGEDEGDVGARGWRSRRGVGGESMYEESFDESRRPLRGDERDEDTSYRGRGAWI